jgi:AbrB family looped-hinge helix DNA binding protein
VIEDGRVTIPKHVRQEVGIEKGDYVIVDVQPFPREVTDD